MTSTSAQLTDLLDGLAQRARGSDKPDLSPAIGVVNDLGRLVVGADEAALRDVQASVAALREQLDGEEVAKTPAKALAGERSHAYLAGAMWAINEVMGTRLRSLEYLDEVPRGVTRRRHAADLVVLAMSAQQVASPTELLKAISGFGEQLRADEVSRALSELLSGELVEVSDRPTGVDRRKKFFKLTASGIDAAARLRHDLASVST